MDHCDCRESYSRIGAALHFALSSTQAMAIDERRGLKTQAVKRRCEDKTRRGFEFASASNAVQYSTRHSFYVRDEKTGR